MIQNSNNLLYDKVWRKDKNGIELKEIMNTLLIKILIMTWHRKITAQRSWVELQLGQPPAAPEIIITPIYRWQKYNWARLDWL